MISPVPDEILFDRRGSLAIVQLNRPAALNAQNLAMVRAFAAQLRLWEADPTVTALFMHGAGDKAFCAGGDIRALWVQPPNVPDTGRMAFFTAEYALCAALRATRLETIAYMDGVTMGGGVGLSVYAKHRIATPKTVWAMPEAAIGFFPDICASHFLTRLTVNGQPATGLGRALGLTGLRLKGADCLEIVADHTLSAGQDAALIDALALDTPVPDTLQAFAIAAARPALPALASDLQLYADLKLPLFLDLLAGRGLIPHDYNRMLCAFSLCVIDEALQRGARQSYAETMAMDDRVVRNFLVGDTFYEGVRARLIDRDTAPRWAGQTVADIDPALVEAAFR